MKHGSHYKMAGKDHRVTDESLREQQVAKAQIAQHDSRIHESVDLMKLKKPKPNSPKQL